jgi:hypothetical protein
LKEKSSGTIKNDVNNTDIETTKKKINGFNGRNNIFLSRRLVATTNSIISASEKLIPKNRLD